MSSSSNTASATFTPIEVPRPPSEAHDFAALYQLWFRQVHRWIGRLGGTGIDVEDLTQEVFIVVHRKLDRFDGANLAGWLYRIAQLTVHDHRHRAWSRNSARRSRDVVIDELASVAAAQDEQFDDKNQKLWLYRRVAQLNPRWRQSFLLFEICGLTSEEIASLQGIPAATVRTHLSRARREIIDQAAELRARSAPAQ
jgi:RNA polymerase sigma-70 factor (ECF subfamily)